MFACMSGPMRSKNLWQAGTRYAEHAACSPSLLEGPYLDLLLNVPFLGNLNEARPTGWCEPDGRLLLVGI